MRISLTQASLILPAVVLCFGLFTSSSGGRNDNWAGAPGDNGNCGACHGGPSTGTISLTGVPATISYGQVYPLTVTISDPSAAVGGLQIVAFNPASNTQIGTFAAGVGTRVTPGGRIVHSSPKPFSSGTVSWTFNWTAPMSGSQVRFYFSGNAANGNGSTSGDKTYTSSTAQIPLPVQLTNLSLQRSEQGVLVQWETATEYNTSHFEVQRSEDGVNFSKIGEVAARNSADKTGLVRYTFTDTQGTNRKRLYYRLVDVDFGGLRNISKTVSITLAARSEIRFLSAQPLQTSMLRLSVEAIAALSQVQVRSIDGRLIGSAIVSDLSEVSIDMSFATSGLYVIQVLDESGHMIDSQKFIKL